MTTYTGTFDITGSVEASQGGQRQQATFSGNFASTLSATLDNAGNGTAIETLSGSISVQENGETGTVPYSLSIPSFSFHLGTFQINQAQPVSIPGWEFDVVLSGLVNNNQSQISESETVEVSGTYDGWTFSGNATGSALLLVQPVLETISGTKADQPTSDTSRLSPFQNVVVTDPNAGQTDTVTVTLSDPANGTLSNLGGGSYNAGNGVYTISGTTAAVSAALNGLVFTPTFEQSPAGQTVTTGFMINVTDTAGESASDSTTSVITTESGPTLTTLVNFNGTNGATPWNGLVADATGNLFGTTAQGGANNDGTVFEIAKTGEGYAGTPTVLVSYNYPIEQSSLNGLITDSAGNLFGTTSQGGTYLAGTVFEVAKTGGSYGNTLTTLANFTGIDEAGPAGGLIADSSGNFFGTTGGGGVLNGSVFELTKTGGRYASTPTTLARFNSTNAGGPSGSLIADTAGDLFGTTENGGASGDGTVFEISKTGSSYASTPTTLVSFDGTNGQSPLGGLVADAAGNLFGTTYGGGAYADGTVFELAKTSNGYANTPTTLVSFNGTNGALPRSGLLADAAGDLFGTTFYGGPNDGDGTVFEIAKTSGSYAGTPTTLATFSGANGANPQGALITDATGNLFGTTSKGGPNGNGTAFELTNSGFVACYAAGTRIATPTGERAIETLAEGDLVLTCSDEARPIVWLGHRRLDCRRHPKPQDVWPVRVSSHALGCGLPRRDLFLSPDHAVFLDGVLIPIRCLVNGRTIAQETCDEVTYWHVELPQHDVLLAEGLPAESYLDTGNRGAFDNAGGPVMLHPHFAKRVWDAKACAQQMLGGPPLIVAKRRVQVQAALLGHACTNDPKLRIRAQGRELVAETDGARWRIELPKQTDSVRLTSRAGVPAHMRPDENDTRSLGVAVGRLWLDRREIGLDSPGLCAGWHAPEPGRRWTDGDAGLAVTGMRELAFEVVMTGAYWHDEQRRHGRGARRYR